MPEPNEATPNSEILRGKQLLVVDDEQMVATLFKRFLERKGAVVRTASNGREALTAIKEQKPDLVITDRDMPEMTGPQMIAELRKNSETAELPIILASGGEFFAGLNPQQVQEKAISVGASAGIAKPIDFFGPINPIKMAEELLTPKKS